MPSPGRAQSPLNEEAPAGQGEGEDQNTYEGEPIMTILTDTTDIVESKRQSDVRPCTDPFCIHAEHDWADAEDFEHKAALKFSGKSYTITLSRDIQWKPSHGTPEGWYVEPYVTESYMTPDEVTQLITDLNVARATCVKANTELARRERLLMFPLDALITTEIEAMIADREWSLDVAAVRFGMTQAKLQRRLRAHAPWTAEEVVAVAHAFVGDDWYDLVSRWFAHGSGERARELG